MKTHDFINTHIGEEVYIKANPEYIHSMGGKIWIFTCGKDRKPQRGLRIVKLTKAGMAYLYDCWGEYFSIPPRYVRLLNELDENGCIKNISYDGLQTKQDFYL